ncbi:MAG: ATP-binding protein [Phycisphaeraceae bacterium]
MVAANTAGAAPPSAACIGVQAATHLRILSHADWVEKIVMQLRWEALQHGVCDEQGASRLVIAMTEAITNAIVHGNYELDSAIKNQDPHAFRELLEARGADHRYSGRTVEIQATYNGPSCVWTISDQGSGFDVEAALKKLQSDDPEAILSSGRGIAIMKAFLDEVRWLDHGRTIRLALGEPATHERRQQERSQYTYPLGLRWDATRAQAIACDLSAGGIAFITEFALEPRTPVTIDLIHGVSPRQLTGKVARHRHVAGHFHHVAVHFDQPQDDL